MATFIAADAAQARIFPGRPTAPLTLDQDHVREQLAALETGTYEQQLGGLGELTRLLEEEEGRFREAAGDPFTTPTVRNGHNIGRLMSMIKESDELYAKVTDDWVLSSRATLLMQVAGLRFLLALCSCFLYQYPLTDSDFMAQLLKLVSEGADTAACTWDPAPVSEEAMLKEARFVYATGLCAIAMGNLDHADDVVKTPMVGKICKHLRRAILQAPAGSDVAENCSKGATEGAGAACASPQAEGVKTSQGEQALRETESGKGVATAAAAAATAAGTGAATAAGTGAETAAAAAEAAAEAATAAETAAETAAAAAAAAVELTAIGVVAKGRVASQATGSDLNLNLKTMGVQLRQSLVMYCIQLVARLGEYVECLGPLLQEQGVEVQIELLRRYSPEGGCILFDVLDMLCALLAHRRFAEFFVEQGGIPLLLGLPRSQHVYTNQSMALYGLSSLPVVFERVCALGPVIVQQLVSTALMLLGCGFDQARKGAAVFLSTCIHFRAVLKEFDAQDGLRRLLNTLRAVLMIVRGGHVVPDMRIERQVAHHSCMTILQWQRAHLVLHVESLKLNLSLKSRTSSSPPPPPPPYKPLDVSRESLDCLLASLDCERRIAELFVRSRWQAVETFLEAGGAQVMLELVQYAPPERWFHEMTITALLVLQLTTLAPVSHRTVAGVLLPNQRPGMAVLLWAAGGQPSSAYVNSDPEAVAAALHVIANCVAPPSSVAELLNPSGSAGASSGGSGRAGGSLWRTSTQATPVQNNTSGGTPMWTPAAGNSAPADVGGGGAAASLGQSMEDNFAYTRQCLRSNNGMRVLMQQLSQPSGLARTATLGAHHSLSGGGLSTSAASGAAGGGALCPSQVLSLACRIRALSARSLLGMARDPHMRSILSKLQVGRLLAELVREPMGPPSAPGTFSAHAERHAYDYGATGMGVGRRMNSSSSSGRALYWPEVFNRTAMELIALTSTSVATARPDRVSAAATDAAGPALQKIERAAIAASTHITYAPQELLIIIYDHLRASGLSSSAAALAREASLARTHASMLAAANLSHPSIPSSSAAAPGAAPAEGSDQLGPASKVCITPLPPGGLPSADAGPATGRRAKAGTISISASLSAIVQRPQHQNPTASAAVAGEDIPQPQPQGQTPQPQTQTQPQTPQPQIQIQPHMLGQGQLLGTPVLAGGPPPTAGAPGGLLFALTPVRATEAVEPQGLLTLDPSQPPSQATATPAVSGTKRKAPVPAEHLRGPTANSTKSSGKVECRRPGFGAVDQAGPPATPTPKSDTVEVAAGQANSDGLYISQLAAEVAPARVHSSSRAHSKSNTTPSMQRPASRLSTPLGVAPLSRAATPIQQISAPPALAVTTSDHHRSTFSLLHNSTNPAPGFLASMDRIASAGGPNPLLAGLPSRNQPSVALGSSSTIDRARSNTVGVDTAGGASAGDATTPIAALRRSAPKELPIHMEAAIQEVRAVAGPPANSKLHNIVMSHLKHQHRQACMHSATPTVILPPIPLSKPYSLPQASRALEAPQNVAARLARREAGGGHGGRGGTAAERRLVFSRFRQIQMVRDDVSITSCAAFIGDSDAIATGALNGEIRIIDSAEGELLESYEGHLHAITSMGAYGDAESGGLLLTSTRNEVKLWQTSCMLTGAVATWEGTTKGRFNHAGTQVIGVSSYWTSPRQAYIYDIRTREKIATLKDSPQAGSPMSQSIAAARSDKKIMPAACWNRTDSLVLWGCTLWDPRAPKALHQFDQFTQSASGCFHPRAQEVILNSEVWDLRTYRLLRSVPGLDDTTPIFNGTGDVIYAMQRLNDGAVSNLLNSGRIRHALHSAFRTIDATSYVELATVDVERAIVDIAVEASDQRICLATLDQPESGEIASCVRIYEVGRQRAPPGGDDDDDDDDDGEESDEESEDDVDGSLDDSLFGSASTSNDDGGDEDPMAARAGGVWRRRQVAAAGAAGGGGGDGGPDVEAPGEGGPSDGGNSSQDDGVEDDEDDSFGDGNHDWDPEDLGQLLDGMDEGDDDLGLYNDGGSEDMNSEWDGDMSDDDDDVGFNSEEYA